MRALKFSVLAETPVAINQVQPALILRIAVKMFNTAFL